MSEYKCQNGDLIRVGGVYVYLSGGAKYYHAVTRIDGNFIVGYEFGQDDDALTNKFILNELPRDADGYYIWNGGAQPVPDEWVIQFKNSNTTYKYYAADKDWSTVTAFKVVSTGQEVEDWCAVGKKVCVIDELGTFTVSKVTEDDGVFLSNGGQHCRTELEPYKPLTPAEPNTDDGPPTTAEGFLSKAASLMAERAKDYDKPDGERSTGKAVHAFNAITGKDLTEAEGWLIMSLVKRVRQYSSPNFHRDSAEDAVAYAALEAEALARGE